MEKRTNDSSLLLAIIAATKAPKFKERCE